MKIMYLLLSLVLLTSCSTHPPRTWSLGDGSMLTIEQAGCRLDLMFKNNSNRDILLGGNILVTQKYTGEAVATNYVSWNSDTVPAGGFVRGISSAGGSMDYQTQLAVQGFACANSYYDQKITFSNINR
jgi:heme A synthase